MTFNEYINTGFHSYRLEEREDKVNDMLLEFTDNMIDTSKVNFTINEYCLIMGWDISYNDDYTDMVFNTDKTILNRKIKIGNLLNVRQ